MISQTFRLKTVLEIETHARISYIPDPKVSNRFQYGKYNFHYLLERTVAAWEKKRKDQVWDMGEIALVKTERRIFGVLSARVFSSTPQPHEGMSKGHTHETWPLLL